MFKVIYVINSIQSTNSALHHDSDTPKKTPFYNEPPTAPPNPFFLCTVLFCTPLSVLSLNTYLPTTHTNIQKTMQKFFHRTKKAQQQSPSTTQPPQTTKPEPHTELDTEGEKEKEVQIHDSSEDEGFVKIAVVGRDLSAADFLNRLDGLPTAVKAERGERSSRDLDGLGAGSGLVTETPVLAVLGGKLGDDGGEGLNFYPEEEEEDMGLGLGLGYLSLRSDDSLLHFFVEEGDGIDGYGDDNDEEDNKEEEYEEWSKEEHQQQQHGIEHGITICSECCTCPQSICSHLNGAVCSECCTCPAQQGRGHDFIFPSPESAEADGEDESSIKASYGGPLSPASQHRSTSRDSGKQVDILRGHEDVLDPDCPFCDAVFTPVNKENNARDGKEEVPDPDTGDGDEVEEGEEEDHQARTRVLGVAASLTAVFVTTIWLLEREGSLEYMNVS